MAGIGILDKSLSISLFTENILDRILTFSQFLKQSVETLKNVKNVFIVSFPNFKGERELLSSLEMGKQITTAMEEAFQNSEKHVNIDSKELDIGSDLNPSNIFSVLLEFLSLLVEGNLCIFNSQVNSEVLTILYTVLLSYLEGIQLEKCQQWHEISSAFSGSLLQLRVILCKFFSVRSCLLKSQNFSLIPVPTFVVQDNPCLKLDSECLSKPPFEKSCWVIQGRLLIGSSISPENIVANGITAILELTAGKEEITLQNQNQSLIYLCFDFNAHEEDFENSIFSTVLRVVGLIQSEENVFINYKGIGDETFLACVFGVLHGIPPLNAIELAVKFHRKCRIPKSQSSIGYKKVESIIKSLHSYKLTLKMPNEIRENYSKFLSKLIPPLAKETDPVMGPIDSSHWVIFNHLIAGSYPGSYVPSETAENLECILAAGVNVFVNLQESYEQRYCESYKNQVIEIAKGRQHRELIFISLEIEDMNVTTDEKILELIFKIISLIFRGHCVYVHCWGGFGRTGTVIALLIGYLYGKDAETCLKLTTLLSQKRRYCYESGSPTTSVQFNQVRRITSQLNPKKK